MQMAVHIVHGCGQVSVTYFLQSFSRRGEVPIHESNGLSVHDRYMLDSLRLFLSFFFATLLSELMSRCYFLTSCIVALETSGNEHYK